MEVKANFNPIKRIENAYTHCVGIANPDEHYPERTLAHPPVRPTPKNAENPKCYFGFSVKIGSGGSDFLRFEQQE